MKNKKISVILPCYNEEKIIKKSMETIIKFSKENPQYEFIFVNDGSTDKTLQIMEKIINKSKPKNLRLISYKLNKGKGRAIKEGVLKANGGYICFTDCDLAYSLDHLILLVNNLEKYDIVIGSRALLPDNRKELSLSRAIAGRTYNFLSRLILNLSFLDMQAGLKGFRNHTINNTFNKQIIKDFSFDVELLYLAKKNKYSIGEIPATLSSSHKYKNSKVNLIKDSFRMFVDLFKIKYNDLKGKYE